MCCVFHDALSVSVTSLNIILIIILQILDGFAGFDCGYFQNHYRLWLLRGAVTDFHLSLFRPFRKQRGCFSGAVLLP